jgi:RNA polymerase sporulation-specific sigma factor
MNETKERGSGIEENLKLVYSLVHKTLYPKFKDIYSQDELIQIGTLGLISASKRFDPKKNIQFSTYASKFIVGYIYNYVHADKFVYAGRINSTKFQRINLAYLDAPIVVDYTTNDKVSLSEMLEYNEDSYESIENKELLICALKTLSEKEREIIEYRYFKNYTQVQVANAIGLTQSYVSRLDARAVKKLRNYMMKEGLVS